MELGIFNQLPQNNEWIKSVSYGSYFYIGKENIKDNRIWLTNNRLNFTQISFENSTLYKDINLMKEIYNNGEAKVYQR